MRRWTLAVALLVAVLLPVRSPADEPEPGEAAAESAPAEAGEAAAPAEAPEAGEDGGTAAEEASEAPGEEAGAAEEPAADTSAGEEEQEEGGFFTPLVGYANNVSTQFLTGLNGLLTWPADPVMAAVDPPKALDKANRYERRPLGFASGLLLMLYRSFTGALDVALAPGPLPVLSPVPRYKLIPGFEHEDE